jgi:hypothetical protein
MNHMATRNNQGATAARSTSKNSTTVRPLRKDEMRGLLGELLLEALQPKAFNPLKGEDIRPVNPEAANDRQMDLATSPADAFFSDIRPSSKHSNHSDATKEAVKLLQEAQRVLAFTNPDLKGKTRKWGVNSTNRKKALETVDQLVTKALRDLTS